MSEEYKQPHSPATPSPQPEAALNTPAAGSEPVRLRATRVAGSQLGGFWIRLVAAIIDGVIVGLLRFPVSLLIVIPIISGMGSSETMAAMGIVVQVVDLVFGLIIIFCYYGWFYSSKGASPGKMIFGLKVVNFETGSYVSWWRAFFRETVGKFLSALILLIGFIMAGFRQDKRALHDLLFRTQVLRRT